MRAFVGRRNKGRKWAISALRNEAGVSINSMKGRLHIARCLHNPKTGGSDGLVGELIRVGNGKFIFCHEEVVPQQWGEGLIVNLFEKVDKEDPNTLKLQLFTRTKVSDFGYMLI